MQHLPNTSQKHYHFSQLSKWKRKHLGYKWADYVLTDLIEVGCRYAHEIAQPEDTTVASFVHILRNLMFQYMTTSQLNSDQGRPCTMELAQF